jgi:hypothetical protein
MSKMQTKIKLNTSRLFSRLKLIALDIRDGRPGQERGIQVHSCGTFLGDVAWPLLAMGCVISKCSKIRRGMIGRSSDCLSTWEIERFRDNHTSNAGRITKDVNRQQLTPIVSTRPRLWRPLWLAIIRLPKPIMVVSDVSITLLPIEALILYGPSWRR